MKDRFEAQGMRFVAFPDLPPEMRARIVMQSRLVALRKVIEYAGGFNVDAEIRRHVSQSVDDPIAYLNSMYDRLRDEAIARQARHTANGVGSFRCC